MPRYSFSTSEEEADFSSDSDSDPFFAGYCGTARPKPTFVSLGQLKRDYTPDMPMEQKIMLFLDAANDEDIRFMETLVRDGVLVDCVGRDGWTALMKACLNGSRNVVRFLLLNGSNANYHANLFTPLMACCTYGIVGEDYKLPCVELILQYGGDANSADKHRCTALMHAASSGYMRIISRLLQVPDIRRNAVDFDGWNAVFHAVANNRYSAVLQLIFSGVDYKLHDNSGRTPQILASEKNFRKLAIALEDMQEVRPKEMEYEDYEEYFSNLLKELPNKKGEGGFTADTKKILSCYGCNVDNVGFADFLNMGEKQLYHAGVKFDVLRRDIMRRVIHKYHLLAWKTTSMPTISRGIPMELDDGICMLACIAKHLTIIKASVRYLLKRVELRKTEAEKTCQKDTITALISLFYLNELVQERLISILELQRNVNLIVDEDLITKPKDNSRVVSKFKFGIIILSVTTGGYLAYHFRVNIGEFIKPLKFIDTKTFLTSMVLKLR